jgi:hypothetical protein
LFWAHDLVGKPVSTFPDHAVSAHDLVGGPGQAISDHALATVPRGEDGITGGFRKIHQTIELKLETAGLAEIFRALRKGSGRCLTA